MNAWEVIPKVRAEKLDKIKDKQRCAEHLASDRCLLKHGHDGHHIRTAKEGRTV